jgi:hypothetical protein
MQTYRVRACNTAHDSENKIHDDDVARRFGFSGALVPGVDVYAYMMHLPVARWGRAFLERGSAECRFASPVYDGEFADVAGREDNGVIRIDVTSGGRECASGWARMPDAVPAVPDVRAFPQARIPEPESRPPASPETLLVGALLGTATLDASIDFVEDYLRDVSESDELYAREKLVHPGTVLRMCNFGLLRNVKLGPWIHVGSRVQNHAAARIGETLAARPRVIANYERKGHLFVELEVLVLGGDERAIAHVTHTAIYRPRQAAAA